jgi:hypothetical protein
MHDGEWACTLVVGRSASTAATTGATGSAAAASAAAAAAAAAESAEASSFLGVLLPVLVAAACEAGQPGVSQWGAVGKQSWAKQW